MKRALKKFIILFMAFTAFASVTLSGCNFIETNQNIGGENTNPPSQTFEKIEVDVDLKNLTDRFGGITYVGASHEGEPYSSVAEAIEETKINRASVAIFITTSSGLICGSGVIVDVDDGVNNGDNENNIFYVTTCNHVISTCETTEASVSVYVPDNMGRNFDDEGYDEKYVFTGKVGGDIDLSSPISLVGGDNASDVAVLRLYVSDETVANNIIKAKIMSDEYSLKLGESVFAIGNSEGSHGGWVSAGVVADTGTVEQINAIGKMNLIGISLDIYPGNSGGGLFNLYGEMVGITNSGKTIEGADGSSSSVGINYAIPLKVSDDKVKDTGFANVVRQLIATYVQSSKNYGYVKGRTDIYWFNLGLLNGRPAISSVVAGSQADGVVKSGDVIVGFMVNNGDYVEVTSYYDISDALYGLNLNDKITIKFARSTGYGKTTTFSRTFTAKQYYFCNTGDYSNILA